MSHQILDYRRICWLYLFVLRMARGAVSWKGLDVKPVCLTQCDSGRYVVRRAIVAISVGEPFRTVSSVY